MTHGQPSRFLLSLVLPPGWVTIPLEDDAARQRAIDRAVDAARLDDGSGATVRRQLRERLETASADAARAGCGMLALSVGAGPNGVPLSGSLVGSYIPGTAVPEVDALPAEPGDEFDTATVPAGRVVRRVGARETQWGEERLPSLAVDYWLQSQDGVVHLAVSTPLIAYQEAMLELFDTVVETARWAKPR